MAEDEKKIFIDEDWKAQVQREKEQAAQKGQDEPEAEPQGAEEEGGAEMPPPFMALVQSLVTQVMFSLGLIAGPDQKQVYVDLGQARFILDMLGALKEKTQGNLEEEEEQQLTEALAELERAYMTREQQANESSLRQAGINPQDLGKQG